MADEAPPSPMDAQAFDPSAKFWCHQCQAEVRPPQGDFACPTCGSEFIELIETESDEDHPTHFRAYDDAQQQQQQQQHLPQAPFPLVFPLIFGQQPPQNHHQPPPFLDIFQQVNQFMQAAFQPPPPQSNSNQQQQQQQPPQPQINFNMFQIPMFPPFAQGGQQQQGPMPFGAMLQQLFNVMGIPVAGNPGDYVGDAAFDNIITQLFESASDRGPPPAAQDAIDAIPTVRVDQESVDNKEDCPVCKEEFVLDEEVMKLDCNHRFHPDCLKRWLAIRNTCPVCRFKLKPGEKTSKFNFFNNNNNNNNGGGGGGIGGGGGHSNSADSPSQFYV